MLNEWLRLPKRLISSKEKTKNTQSPPFLQTEDLIKFGGKEKDKKHS